MAHNDAFETDAVQRCALHGAAKRQRYASLMGTPGLMEGRREEM